MSGCSGCGCSGTQPVSLETQKLYKHLGFNDKNGNGVIEKKSIWNLWTDEGYKEEADDNLDGKITEAEAKYYLLTSPAVSEEVKQKFELGQKEEKEEKDKMCNWNLQFSWCSEKVSKMAEVGLFDKALKVARIIEDSDRLSDCLITIASELAKAKFLDKTVKADLFREIIEVACTIKDLFTRSNVLSEIASEMAKAGIDKTEENKAFQLATDAAKAVNRNSLLGGNTAHALCIVASNMAEGGLFNEALKVAYSIYGPYGQWDKSIAFSEIASEMAKAGWGKAEVSRAFQSAIDAAMAMEKNFYAFQYNRPFALGVAVSRMAEAGLDKTELRKALQLYIKVLAIDENQKALSAHLQQKLGVLDIIYSVGEKAGLNMDEINKMLKDAGFPGY